MKIWDFHVSSLDVYENQVVRKYFVSIVLIQQTLNHWFHAWFRNRWIAFRFELLMMFFVKKIKNWNMSNLRSRNLIEIIFLMTSQNQLSFLTKSMSFCMWFEITSLCLIFKSLCRFETTSKSVENNSSFQWLSILFWKLKVANRLTNLSKRKKLKQLTFCSKLKDDYVINSFVFVVVLKNNKSSKYDLWCWRQNIFLLRTSRKNI